MVIAEGSHIYQTYDGLNAIFLELQASTPNDAS